MKMKRAVLIVSFVLACGCGLVPSVPAYFIGDVLEDAADGYPKILRVDAPSEVLPSQSFRVEIFAQRAVSDHILGGFLHMGRASGNGRAWLKSPDCVQIGDEVYAYRRPYTGTALGHPDKVVSENGMICNPQHAEGASCFDSDGVMMVRTDDVTPGTYTVRASVTVAQFLHRALDHPITEAGTTQEFQITIVDLDEAKLSAKLESVRRMVEQLSTVSRPKYFTKKSEELSRRLQEVQRESTRNDLSAQGVLGKLMSELERVEQDADVLEERRRELPLYTVVPGPLDFRARSAEAGFPLSADITVVFPGAAKAEFSHARKILVESLTGLRISWSEEIPQVAAPHIYVGRCAADSVVGLACVAERLKPPAHEDGYVVRVREKAAYLIGNTPRGVLYAVETFRQIAEQARSEKQIQALDIRDAPAYTFRCGYMDLGVFVRLVVPERAKAKDQKDSTRKEAEWVRVEKILDEMAAHKLNALFVSSDWYTVYSDIPENMASLKRLAGMCAERHIEFVPDFQGLGHASAYTFRYPHYTEGIWFENEELTLNGLAPTELEQPNVLVTKRSRIVVKNKGAKLYRADLDYKVIPGETASPFKETNEPWRIARLAGGAIVDGETVHVSYNARPHRRHDYGYCPMELEHLEKHERPMVHQFMKTFKPEYISLGRDEVRGVKTDSRCIESGKTPAQLFADDCMRVAGYAREIDPQVEVMMFDDMLRGDQPTADAIPLLPRWVILVVWMYEENKAAWAQHATDYYAEQGLRVIGGPLRSRPVNIDHWAKAIRAANSDSPSTGWNTTEEPRSPGFVFLGWNDVYDWKAMAEAGWGRDE